MVLDFRFVAVYKGGQVEQADTSNESLVLALFKSAIENDAVAYAQYGAVGSDPTNTYRSED